MDRNITAPRARRLRLLVAAMIATLAAGVVPVLAAPQASAATSGQALACRASGLRGYCQWFHENTPDLRYSSSDWGTVGNDDMSSVYLPPGNTVVLWEHINYTGRCQVLSAGATDHYERWLTGSAVGDDQVSSISFGNDHPCTHPTAFARLTAPHWSESLYANVTDLTNTDLGNDTVTSVTAGDQPVAVYSDAKFEGSCRTVSPGYTVTLSHTYVGAGRASSVAIGHRCEDDIRLCEHADFGGRCISLTSSKPRLSATDLGNDTASSLRLPDGWKATLYQHDSYKGLYDKVPHPFVLMFNGLGTAGGWGDITTNFPVEGDLFFPGVVGNDGLSSIELEGPSACRTMVDPRCVGIISP